MKIMKLNKSSCTACGGNQNSRLYSLPNYITGTEPNEWNMPIHYVICELCGCIYLDPAPSDLDLNEFYSNAVISPPKKLYQLNENDCKFTMFETTKPEFKFNSVFEVGAGTGELLYYININYPNINIHGIELSKHLVKHIRDEYKFNIQQTDIMKYNTTNKYDLIILDNVLEHFSNPKEVLCKVATMLNGMAYIVVPDIMATKPGIRDQFSGHMSNFMLENLRVLLYSSGLQIDTYNRIDGSLIIWCSKLQESYQLPVVNFTEYIIGIKEAINFIISNQKYTKHLVYKHVQNLLSDTSKKWLIYGAGEHTSQVIRDLKPTNIIGLIDSNQLYQHTNICGYYVYSPMEINSLEYDGILISSHSAETKIYKYIFNNLNVDMSKVFTIYKNLVEYYD